jgi:hypothetical protein
MGESTNQRRARQASGRAVETLGEGYTAYTEDPLTMALRNIVSGVVEQPLQNDVLGLAPGMASEAHRGAKNFLNERYDQLSSMGAGFRGGASRASEIMAAGGLGDALSRIGPQLAVQQNQERLNAATTAANLARSILGDQYDWFTKISNAFGGHASTLSSLAQQGTPIGNALSGLGGILGSIASTPGNIFRTVAAR